MPSWSDRSRGDGRFEETTFEVALVEQVPVAHVEAVTREQLVVRASSRYDEVIVDGHGLDEGEDNTRELDPGQ